MTKIMARPTADDITTTATSRTYELASGRPNKPMAIHFGKKTAMTAKSPPIPIALFDESYWRTVINFDALAEHGMIDPRDLELFGFAETAEEIWQVLEAKGLHTVD